MAIIFGQTISDSSYAIVLCTPRRPHHLVFNHCSLSVVRLLITSQESAISLIVYIQYVYFSSFLF